MKKTIFIDAQLFQTSNWYRGTGRYAFALIDNLTKLDNKNIFLGYDVVFICSNYLSQKGEWRDSLALIFPNSKFKFLNLLTVNNDDQCFESMQKNRIVLESYLTLFPKGSEYILPSVLDDSIYAVLPVLSNIDNFLIFHDLIPLLFPHEYFNKSNKYENDYNIRLLEIFKAKNIFTNSKTTARDLAMFMSILPEKIIPILGGAYPLLTPKKSKLNLNSRDNYILAVLGDDPRKNIIRSCQAFKEFTLKYKTYKLVLTSIYSFKTKEKILKILNNNVIFVGQVDDNDLSWLYKHAKALLFTSEYEGLGMPILEAMQANVPIVCSDIEIMREIAGESVYYANPYDVIDIASELTKAIKEGLSNQKRNEYKHTLEKFSWPMVASRFADGLLNSRKVKEIIKKNNKKIAIVGPTPESINTIGKVIQEQYSYWNDVGSVDYYLEESPTSPSFKKSYLTASQNYFAIDKFTNSSKTYDHIFYHIGNSDFHLQTVRLALSISGIVILHDLQLKGLWHEMQNYKLISKNRFMIEGYLTKVSMETRGEFINSIVNSAKHIIVHSLYAENIIKNINPKASVTTIELPIPYYVDQEAYKINKKKLTIGLGGILTLDKGLNIVNDLLQDKRFEEIIFSVFGHKTIYDGGLVEEFADNPRIRVSTNLTDYEYKHELQNVDIFLNYRKNYHGESSRSTLEAMRLGIVVVVRNIGWFSELPDDAVIKVNSEKDVGDAILKITEQTQGIINTKNAALKYIHNHCRNKTYIDSIITKVQDQ